VPTALVWGALLRRWRTEVEFTTGGIYFPLVESIFHWWNLFSIFHCAAIAHSVHSHGGATSQSKLPSWYVLALAPLLRCPRVR
jgi:hypothetical protein